jgi:RNA polymerase sigma-70 factor (ECF subfamily)
MPLLAPEPDRETVDQVLNGNSAKFEVLMRRHNQRLYRVARAILRNDADAEDAVQQAYVSAYCHLHEFKWHSQFSTWLTRIVVFEALSKRRRQRRALVEHLEDGAHNVACTQADPERQTYAGELSVLLRSAVRSLPAAYRSVFVLRQVKGLSTTETAQRLCLTENATKTRFHRAKGLLQQTLKSQRG